MQHSEAADEEARAVSARQIDLVEEPPFLSNITLNTKVNAHSIKFKDKVENKTNGEPQQQQESTENGIHDDEE